LKRIMTLREILEDTTLPNRTIIEYTGNVPSVSFNKGDVYRVYTSWGKPRVYCNKDLIWAILPSDKVPPTDGGKLAYKVFGRQVFRELMGCEFEVDMEVNVGILWPERTAKPKDWWRREEYPPPDFTEDKTYEAGSEPVLDDGIDSAAYALREIYKREEMETIMSSSKSAEFLDTVNSKEENIKQVQKICEKKTLQIDLLTLLSESDTFTSLEFGKRRLLEDLIVDGETVVCRISDGVVDTKNV